MLSAAEGLVKLKVHTMGLKGGNRLIKKGKHCKSTGPSSRRITGTCQAVVHVRLVDMYSSIFGEHTCVSKVNTVLCPGARGVISGPDAISDVLIVW